MCKKPRRKAKEQIGSNLFTLVNVNRLDLQGRANFLRKSTNKSFARSLHRPQPSVFGAEELALNHRLLPSQLLLVEPLYASWITHVEQPLPSLEKRLQL